MTLLPTAKFAANLLDAGGEVFNVRHPDYGAVGDGVADDGPAWNLARAALNAAGGIVLVPQGAYLLTTAFTFAAATNVLLVLQPGVVLTGSALPAPAGTNAILDLRSGTVRYQGVGPYAIGGTGFTNVQTTFHGSYTSSGVGSAAYAGFWGSALTGAGGDTLFLTGVGLENTIITQTATENIAVISQLRVVEPSITDNLTGDITVAATVHIVDAPTEGEANFALLVDSGATRFDGNIGFYATAPIAQQTGVAVTAAGIHAALVNLGLITA